MKAKLILTAIAILFAVLPSTSYAQYNNVVINEVTGDAGQSDGCNDGILELAGPPGTDIGCMVVTNTEWAVVIPPGTLIPADGTFLIACGEDATSNCGVGILGTSNGLACAECDFPNLPIDLDVCDPTNSSYYSPSATGFTIDNQTSNQDGDNVILFQPDGTPHDALYWGGGAMGNSDHCTIQTGSYTLGDNDMDGVVNNSGTNSVVAGRCDGNNATGVAMLPNAGTCNAASTLYTVPPITDPIWVDVGMSMNGCNSSFIRIAGSPNAGPNNSHNAVAGTAIPFASLTPSSAGNAAAAAQWAYTDHPTPGQPNDSAAWNVTVSQDVLCAPGSVTITMEIYNWQHVSDNSDTRSGVDNLQVGSFIMAPTTDPNAAPMADGTQVWTTYATNPATGVTTLTYTTGILPAGTHMYTVQWDDYTNCCGSTTSTSGTNQCYEQEDIVITIAEPLVVSAMSVACPGDFAPGTVNIGSLTTGGYNNSYCLIADGVPVDTNMSGIFSLPTGIATSTLAVQVKSADPCPGSAMVTIDINCITAPPCPMITSEEFLVNDMTCSGGAAGGAIFTESFEGATTWTAAGVFSDGSNDYFDLIGDGTDPTGVPNYTGADGTRYWAAEDVQDAGNPNGGQNVTLSFTGIDISGCTGNISVTGLFAAGSTSHYDASDYMHINAQVDGGGFSTVGAFESTAGGGNTTLSQDTNGDGDGDGTVLGLAFANFVFPVTSGTGTTLDITIDIFMTAGSEAVAFDNIQVFCDQAGGGGSTLCMACPGDEVCLIADGTDLPVGGTIDWYSSPTTPFNPYNGEGTLVGSANVTQTGGGGGGGAYMGPVVINEVLYDAPSGCDGSSGGSVPAEFIELYGQPGANVGCWIITDGDFEIVLPPTTTIPADGYLLIGQPSTTCTGGTPSWNADIDVNTATCACISSASGEPTFTNGGEFVFLYDPTGAFQDGVAWGSGCTSTTSTNNPDVNASETVAASTAGCTPPASVTTSGQAYACSPASGDQISIERDVDGNTGVWQADNNGGTTAGGPNGAAPIVITVDTVKYTITNCNDTLYFKGIINPHPNTMACPNTDAMASTSEFAVGVSCPIADLQPMDSIKCASAGPADIVINLSGGTGPYTVVYEINGFQFTQTGATDPFVINIPAPSGGLIDVNLVSVMDEGGSMCPGTVDSDQAEINIFPDNFTATMSGSTVICDDSASTAQISIAFTGSGPWEFDFTDGTDTFTSVSSVNPFLMVVSDVANFSLLRVENEAGCEGTVSGMAAVTPADEPAFTITDEGCDDGMVVLTDNSPAGLTITSYTAITDVGTVTGMSPLNLTGATMATIIATGSNGCLDTIMTTFPTCNGPLPIELIEFWGVAHDESIILNWATANETNNSHFNVMKSDNGFDFIQLGVVQGAGTTTIEQQYGLLDNDPTPGINYYQLIQVDFDGTESKSNVIEVHYNTSKQSLRVMPNPTQGLLRIELTKQTAQQSWLEIHDLIGQKVHQQSLESNLLNLDLDLRDLATGTYVISVFDGRETSARRFIKD